MTDENGGPLLAARRIIKEQEQQLKHARRQRDDLLDALRTLLDCSHDPSQHGCNCFRKARAAVERVDK